LASSPNRHAVPDQYDHQQYQKPNPVIKYAIDHFPSPFAQLSSFSETWPNCLWPKAFWLFVLFTFIAI
jgi:hypothetical protein